jgi:hypothetical protein
VIEMTPMGADVAPDQVDQLRMIRSVFGRMTPAPLMIWNRRASWFLSGKDMIPKRQIYPLSHTTQLAFDFSLSS